MSRRAVEPGSGYRDGYWWVESIQGDIGNLIRSCPGVLLGRCVAVTSFDSGPLHLSEVERADDWVNAGGVAWSPPLVSVGQFPLSEYEECYTFLQTVPLEDVEVFVNYSSFSLLPAQGPEKEAEWLRDMQARFWSQILRLQPESYLAEGDHLVFVTKEPALFNCIKHVLSGARKGGQQ